MATVLKRTEIRRGRTLRASEKRREAKAVALPSEFSRLRQQAGLTLRDAAEVLGYESRQVYRWENGEIDPRPSVIDALRARRCSSRAPRR